MVYYAAMDEAVCHFKGREDNTLIPDVHDVSKRLLFHKYVYTYQSPGQPSILQPCFIVGCTPNEAAALLVQSNLTLLTEC